MRIENLSQSDFLRSIRMARVWVLCDPATFVAHVYRTVLKRNPESDLSLPSLPEGDPWDRLSFLISVLKSPESVETTNLGHDAVLAAFFSGLGYLSSVSLLSELMKDLSPTAESFLEQIDSIHRIVATNTERVFFGTISSQAFNELDGAASLANAASRLEKIEQLLATSREEIGHCAWHISDLKGRFSKGNEVPANDYVNGLLHAILARLEMQDSK